MDQKEAEAQKAAEELDKMIERVVAAQKEYASFTQEQVDRIFHHAAAAAVAHRIDLARMAVRETGMGLMEDKVTKNHFAAEYIYHKYKDEKTCGIIEDDPVNGYREIAAPLGVVAGIIPCTNPTSTAIFKALLCLKTRNGIIFSPHPRAPECTRAAAEIIRKAAVEAGAPEHIIDCIEKPSLALSQQLMGHKGIALILATGGVVGDPTDNGPAYWIARYFARVVDFRLGKIILEYREPAPQGMVSLSGNPVGQSGFVSQFEKRAEKAFSLGTPGSVGQITNSRPADIRWAFMRDEFLGDCTENQPDFNDD